MNMVGPGRTGRVGRRTLRRGLCRVVCSYCALCGRRASAGLESTTLASRCLVANPLLLLLLESNRTRPALQIPRQTWRASCTDSQRSDRQLWDMDGGRTRARRFFLEGEMVLARRGGWNDSSGRSEESGRMLCRWISIRRDGANDKRRIG